MYFYLSCGVQTTSEAHSGSNGLHNEVTECKVVVVVDFSFAKKSQSDSIK